MTEPALSIRHEAPSLEQLREAWRSELGRQREGRRTLARATWPLFLRWSVEQRNASRHQFLVWLSGEADPPKRLYNYLGAGFALHSGLDFDLGVSDLATLGKALDSHSPDALREMLEAQGMEGVRKLVSRQRQEGHVTLPASELPAVRAAVESVSQNEGLPAPQALALIVQGHAAMSPEMQQAVLTAARTGQSIEDGAREVVARLLDSRSWLAAQPCAVPGCGMASSDLHHLKLTGTRFRSQEVLLPLCRRHHEAEPGLSSEAAHAAHQSAWVTRLWGSPEAFWEAVAALYAQRLFDHA